jgi:DNA-binding transcriptional regulator YhcF (GntR family)
MKHAYFDQVDIEFDTKSDVPIWMQINCVLAGMVNQKRIKVGEYIWSIRHVARWNNISYTSVAKACKILKNKGVLESDPKRGYKIGKNVTHEASKIYAKKLKEIDLLTKQLCK